MSDERLSNLEVKEPVSTYGDAVRIEKIRFNNYKFFHGEFELPVNGENLLVYGENGSGKSTIYKALELLTKSGFTDFDENLNIFTDDGDVEVEIGFTNGQELIITSDLEEIPDNFAFLKDLSVFSPLLDYKKLLKIHYSSNNGREKINLYSMLNQLLRDYPVGEGEDEKRLIEIKDFNRYFGVLKKIIKEELLGDINRYLKQYFDADITIESFEFRQEIVESETGNVDQIINLSIDYKEKLIEKYHSFLNEARLSALAISIYFVAIKKMLDTLKQDSLKILVLDDLLISLDMSNRLKLLEIFKNEFTDFQIFFFTHDKELFEIYKDKMNWKKYELYLDDSEKIPKAILKQGKSEIERAKEYYTKKEYDACALLLRKGFEKILKAYLTPKEQRDKNCIELDLSGLVGRSISKSSGENKNILEKLNLDRKHILNPLSHNDIRPVYSQELKSAMEDLEKLKNLLT